LAGVGGNVRSRRAPRTVCRCPALGCCAAAMRAQGNAPMAPAARRFGRLGPTHLAQPLLKLASQGRIAQGPSLEGSKGC
jgi:hypothetical protein